MDGAAGASAAASTLLDRSKQNIPDDTQNRTKDAASKANDKTRNYISNKMPQERRDQTIWRLKKMIVEIQGHQDCTQATLFDLPF